MGDPLSKLIARKPTKLLLNSKVSNNAPASDTLAENKKNLPSWAKWIIGCNIIMIHLIVMLVGFSDISFTLSDTALVVYIIIGLGMPVGLANQTIQTALGNIFGIKS